MEEFNSAIPYNGNENPVIDIPISDWVTDSTRTLSQTYRETKQAETNGAIERKRIVVEEIIRDPDISAQEKVDLELRYERGWEDIKRENFLKTFDGLIERIPWKKIYYLLFILVCCCSSYGNISKEKVQ